MRETLRANEQPISKIFSDGYAFSIPRYQRPYAWTTEQVGELLDDLQYAARQGGGDIGSYPPYFLGSVVLIKDPEKPDAEVVDGQQRLTTLTILLCVMRELADTGKSKRD